MGRHLSSPRRPFWGPLVAILGFAGVAGGERVPPSSLGWYYTYISVQTNRDVEHTEIVLFRLSFYLYTTANPFQLPKHDYLDCTRLMGVKNWARVDYLNMCTFPD